MRLRLLAEVHLSPIETAHRYPYDLAQRYPNEKLGRNIHSPAAAPTSPSQRLSLGNAPRQSLMFCTGTDCSDLASACP